MYAILGALPKLLRKIHCHVCDKKEKYILTFGTFRLLHLIRSKPLIFKLLIILKMNLSKEQISYKNVLYINMSPCRFYQFGYSRSKEKWFKKKAKILRTN